MWECSGNHSESKPRASTSLANSTGWMLLSVGNIMTPRRMARLSSGWVVRGSWVVRCGDPRPGHRRQARGRPPTHLPTRDFRRRLTAIRRRFDVTCSENVDDAPADERVARSAGERCGLGGVEVFVDAGDPAVGAAHDHAGGHGEGLPGPGEAAQHVLL